MNKYRFHGFFACAAVTAALLLAPASAHADEAQDEPAIELLMDQNSPTGESEITIKPGPYTDANGDTVNVRGPGAHVRCKGVSDTPHWSKEGKSVISKTRVTCTGFGVSKVSVRVLSYLGVGTNSKGANMRIVAQSDYSQLVAVNGDRQTWYVPSQNSATKIQAGGWFKASHSGKIAQSGAIGAAASKVAWVNKR